MWLIHQLYKKLGFPSFLWKKVGKFSLLQPRICTFKKTLEYNESCFSIQVWYSTFFKDKPGANDDMCVCFIDLMFRYLVVLGDIHK